MSQEFLDSPKMISEAAGHGWRDGVAPFPAQLLVSPTPVVRTANQPHASFEQGAGAWRMTTSPRQAGQPLSKGAIDPFNKSRIEHLSSRSAGKKVQCLFFQTMCHPSDDLNHVFFCRAFDHRPNQQLWPNNKLATPLACEPWPLFSNGSANAVGVSRPAVGQDQ